MFKIWTQSYTACHCNIQTGLIPSRQFLTSFIKLAHYLSDLINKMTATSCLPNLLSVIIVAPCVHLSSLRDC